MESEYDKWLLEYDGEQHFHPVKFANIADTTAYKNYISTQVKDWYKDYYCIKNNISLIRIPYKIVEIIELTEQDFVNYKKPSFNIAAGISCTFKCCPNDITICQNSAYSDSRTFKTTIDELINRYISQNISNSITIQGLEPLDNLKQVLWLIYYFRKITQDDIVIWTGYTEDECCDLIFLINKMDWSNIVIKFGRFVPNQKPHYDDVLGVNLASDNQYGKRF